MSILSHNNLTFSSCSTRGFVRIKNEDNLYCNGKSITAETRQKPFYFKNFAQTPCIFAVCDGMGGEAHGDLASMTAINVLSEHAEKIKSKIKSQTSSDTINKAVQSFISEVNSRLCHIMREKSLRMGTTLALVVISDELVRAYNIGDSRIYKLDNGILSRISEDHTIVAQKIKMGLLTEEEARHDRSRHVLTRCLGVFEDEMVLTPHIIPPFHANERCRLLLCSDGLTDMLTDKQIQNIMLEHKDTSSAVNELTNCALQNGGKDNITCIIIDFKLN